MKIHFDDSLNEYYLILPFKTSHSYKHSCVFHKGYICGAWANAMSSISGIEL